MKLKIILLVIFFLLIASFFVKMSITSSDKNAQNYLVAKYMVNAPMGLTNKVKYYSELFVGKKYEENPLGEGKTGKYDNDPLYRFDKFDCVTFVETVLAFSISEDFQEFENNMDNIRYKNGTVDFISRNHFMIADWIPNNSNILVDITEKIGDVNIKTFEVEINKKEWFKTMYGIDFKSEENILSKKINYIPVEEINYEKIPSGVIINIVRPNVKTKDKIGTNIAVFHTGFAIRKEGKLLFRHSSLKHKKVVDDDFVEYFKNYKNGDGINILTLM